MAHLHNRTERHIWDETAAAAAAAVTITSLRTMNLEAPRRNVFAYADHIDETKFVCRNIEFDECEQII